MKGENQTHQRRLARGPLLKGGGSPLGPSGPRPAALTPERRSEIMLSNIDTSDCGVIAIQAATKMNRDSAFKLASDYGYAAGVGIDRGAIETALVSIGWTCEPMDVYRNATPATFAMSHEYGLYLVYVDKHVMALVNGDLHNGKGSWGQPIEQVTKIIPPRGVVV